MAEKRKGNSPDHKKTDSGERKKRRRYNPRSQNTNPDDPVRSRGRKPTKKYNPEAGMSTTPSPPVECNQGTESILSASDLAPVTPRRPRRGRPRKLGKEVQSRRRPEENRRLEQDSQPHLPLPPPSVQSRWSSSSHNAMGGPMYGGEESPNEVEPFYGHRFEPELNHSLFPIANPFRQSDTSVPNFNGYFSLPPNFDGMVQNNMGPMHNDPGGGSGMHPVQLDTFELGSQYSPTSIDQRSTSPSSQWSSDNLSRVASITPEDRHFPPTPYFFDTMPLADPHWPTHSANSQGTFIPGIDLEGPGMVGHSELVIGDFSSSQPFPGAALNSTMGPSSHGNNHQSSQGQNSQSMQHEMQGHIPYADCNCPACQHFHAQSGWRSGR